MIFRSRKLLGGKNPSGPKGMGPHHGEPISRRTFLSLAGASSAGASLLLSPPLSVSAVPPTQVRFDGWGGSVQQALSKYAFKEFTDATGISVAERSFADEADVFNKLKGATPGEFQLIHSFGLDSYKKYFDIGWASQINEDNIPHLQTVMSAMIAPLRKINPRLSGIPIDYGTSGIAYNRKYISDIEARQKGAMLLLDPRFSGKISGFHDMRTRVWYAALQTKQNPNSINDIGAIWITIRDFLGLTRSLWRSGAELMELLINEDIIVADAWSGRIASLQQQGHPIGYFNPLGSYTWMETIVILNGSPMPECEELCNFLLSVDSAIAVAEAQNYPPSLDPVKISLDREVTSLPSFDDSGTMGGFSFADPVYWSGNAEAWQKQWYLISQGG